MLGVKFRKTWKYSSINLIQSSSVLIIYREESDGEFQKHPSGTLWPHNTFYAGKICLSLKLLHAGCHSNASVLLRASSNLKTGKGPSNVTTAKQKLLKFDFKFLLLGILFVNVWICPYIS